MIREEVTIPVMVGDDPLLLLRIQKRQAGTTLPYDLSNVDEIEFIVRAKTGDTTPMATYRLSNGQVSKVDEAKGRIAVQIIGADIDNPPIQHRRYQVRLREVGLWRTVMAGQLALKVA